MEETLSGIERELVLQYLIDGNTPITVTPVLEKKSEGEVLPSSSAVFPVAIKGQQQKVLKEGIILLTNPSENVKNFIGKKVRVEFYFNRLGLYFETQIKKTKSGAALVIPSSISRIADFASKKNPAEFSATLYYSMNQKSDIHIDCVAAEGYDIFSKPAWKDVAEEAQKKAKAYLEEFIAHARKQGVAGSGVQLIPVVRYLAEAKEKMQSVEGRKEPLWVLFANHERIVFGKKIDSEKNFLDLREGEEYALEMLFPVQKPLSSRKIFTSCRVETIYRDATKTLFCAVCRYTSIQKEDLRFLYEKCEGEKLV